MTTYYIGADVHNNSTERAIEKRNKIITNPILARSTMNLTLYLKRVYEKYLPLRTMKNEPKTNPIFKRPDRVAPNPAPIVVRGPVTPLARFFGRLLPKNRDCPARPNSALNCAAGQLHLSP